MLAADLHVLSWVQARLQSGQFCYLCTIVHTYGSSPRPVGSLLACSEQGKLAGSLSGGCVEDDLIQQLQAGALRDLPRRLIYGLDAADSERLGLPCGGHLHLVVEQITVDAHNLHVFAEIVRHLQARTCVARSLRLHPGACSEIEPVPRYAPLVLSDDDPPLLRQVYGPRQRLFIIGAGLVSRHLAAMAQALDYEVLVCDPRRAMLDQWDAPGARMICDFPDDALRDCQVDRRTAIVALTHDPRIDDMGLLHALTTPAFYIAAMGSQKTSAARRQRLRELGVPEADLQRLHAPAGLPIGSKRPAEIATSIVAALVQACSHHTQPDP